VSLETLPQVRVSVLTMAGDDKTGRERKERLRARRDEAGLAQVSGWVPKDRRAYAREVLAALSQGSNSMPPDPEQAAALEAVQAAAMAARIAETAACEALVVAQQHGQALAAELGAFRADAEATQQASSQAEVAALARAVKAEQAREDALDQLRTAEAATVQAQAEAERFRRAPGLRGRALRWLTR